MFGQGIYSLKIINRYSSEVGEILLYCEGDQSVNSWLRHTIVSRIIVIENAPSSHEKEDKLPSADTCDLYTNYPAIEHY